MITYNHEKFIAEAIEGVLMQKTDFPIELIIGEDCSTDRTREICIAYQQQYPGIIKLQLPETNKGMTRNFIENMQAAQGKYIALCEGDDYWTDPQKLQKQVDFLEANPGYNLCCHRYKIYNEANKTWTNDYVYKLFQKNQEGISFDNSLNLYIWFTKTMTMLFKHKAIDFEILNRYTYMRDVHLCYHLLKGSKGYCMNFNAAVYRRHGGGVFSAINSISQRRLNYLIKTELYKYNKEDIDLRKNLSLVRENYFDLIRIQVMGREFSTVLFRDIKVFLGNEFHNQGAKKILYYLRKMILSFFKSFKKKK
jgi:glycosyltransferase involved in cell wall biosynthesis